MAYMKHMKAQQAIIDRGRKLIEERPDGPDQRTLVGANIQKYEFMDEPSKTLFRGKIYFEGGEVRDVRILKLEEKLAKKIYRETSKLYNKAILKVWFATNCEAIGNGILCYEHFDYLLDDWVIKEDIQAGMRYGDDLLHKNGCDLIRSLLEAIIYIHTQGLFHTGLHLTSSYVVVENKIKIINIGMQSLEDLPTPVYDATVNELRVNDLMGFKDVLKKHILQPKADWGDRDLFLSFFDLTTSVRYDVFINKLIKHSFLMKTAEERMKSYFKIVSQSDTFGVSDTRKLKEFQFGLETESFKQYLNWDNKMGDNLRSVYEYEDKNGQRRYYNGQCVMHLIRLLRNAYRHPGKNSMSKLDKNVRSSYPGLLHRIHEVLCSIEEDNS